MGVREPVCLVVEVFTLFWGPELEVSVGEALYHDNLVGKEEEVRLGLGVVVFPLDGGQDRAFKNAKHGIRREDILQGGRGGCLSGCFPWLVGQKRKTYRNGSRLQEFLLQSASLLFGLVFRLGLIDLAHSPLNLFKPSSKRCRIRVAWVGVLHQVSKEEDVAGQALHRQCQEGGQLVLFHPLHPAGSFKEFPEFLALLLAFVQCLNGMVKVIAV